MLLFFTFLLISIIIIFIWVDIEMFSTTQRILLIDLYQVSIKKIILL